MKKNELYNLKQKKLCLELVYIMMDVKNIEIYDVSLESKKKTLKYLYNKLNNWKEKVDLLELDFYSNKRDVFSSELLEAIAVSSSITPVILKYMNNLEQENLGFIIKTKASNYVSKYMDKINFYSDWIEADKKIKYHLLKKRIVQIGLIMSIWFGCDVGYNYVDSKNIEQAFKESVDRFTGPFRSGDLKKNERELVLEKKLDN